MDISAMISKELSKYKLPWNTKIVEHVPAEPTIFAAFSSCLGICYYFNNSEIQICFNKRMLNYHTSLIPETVLHEIIHAHHAREFITQNGKYANWTTDLGVNFIENVAMRATSIYGFPTNPLSQEKYKLESDDFASVDYLAHKFLNQALGV